MKNHPFIYCPARIVSNGLIPNRAKLLYGLILTDAVNNGYSLSTNRELGNIVPMSATQVSNLLDTFEKYGYITCKIIRDKKTNEPIERRLYPDKEDLNSLREFIKERDSLL